MKILSYALRFALTLLVFAFTAFAQSTFTNTTPIPIADSMGFPIVGLGNPYPSVINVSGLSGNTVDVNVTLMGFTHSYQDDVGLLLVSPTGQFMVIQTDSGGGSGVVGLTYTFDDQAMAGIPDEGPFGPGTYLPSSVNDDDIFPISGAMPPPNNCNVLGSCPHAQPAGMATLNGTFGGASPNGDWKLYVVDCCPVDTGTYGGGWSIQITTNAGTVTTRNVDFGGDGKSDYSLIRDLSTTFGLSEQNVRRPGSIREKMQQMSKLRRSRENLGSAPPVGSNQVWYINSSLDNSNQVVGFGDSVSDFVTPADFDGDGRADIAVWRGVGAAGPGGGYFYILNSGTTTVDTVDFGQIGDNPSVVGDYDGDGMADPAVYRCGAVPTQCFFFFKGSTGGGEITYVPWGFGTTNTIFPAPGDRDGDGKFDFTIQRTHPINAGKGQFILLRSLDGGVEYINFGNDTDTIIPGDFDGDGKDDINVLRNQGGLLNWYTLFRAGGNIQVQFGLASDIVTPGDYDNDGKTDWSVWRPDADPDKNYYFVIRSSDLMLQQYEYGVFFDYPLANWAVN